MGNRSALLEADRIFVPDAAPAVYAEGEDAPMIKEKGSDDAQGKHNRVKKSGGGTDISKKKPQ